MNMKNLALVTMTAFVVAPAFAQPKWPLHPLFEREFPSENQLTEDIIQNILEIQNRNKSVSGSIPRPYYTKGVCARAEFEVVEVEDEDLRSGVFAKPAMYSAVVRFANASIEKGDDRDPDGRGLFISLDLGERGRQDFSFINSPTFPVNDVNEYALFLQKKIQEFNLDSWTSTQKQVQSKVWSLIGPYWRARQMAYQKTQFWSGVPFLAGEDAAVKYVVSPCQGNPSKSLHDDRDQLSSEFKRHLNEDSKMSCFNIGVQKLNADVMTSRFLLYMGPKDWVENASVIWSPVEAPVQPVARLTFIPKSILSDDDCEAQVFSVGLHTLSAHRGLGSLNRVLAQVEWVSMKARSASLPAQK